MVEARPNRSARHPDHRGNIIREYLLHSRRAWLCDGFGKEAYFIQEIALNGKHLEPKERDYLVQQLGIDLSETDELNPFIRVGELAID